MIKYVGVNDHNIDLFEGQYHVPNGMSYNSYLLLDEKNVVMDTVDASFVDEWLKNLEKESMGKPIDYLVVLHMEPDHSAGIAKFINKYPNATIVGNSKTFTMIKRFFPNLALDRTYLVNEGDTLCFGSSELKFVFAPMVHWPEVMMAYEKNSKIFFSADAFGKFGALDYEEDWVNEARRYYIGIVGKYGQAVQNLFKKISNIEISAIYPLHGPILKDNLNKYLNLYQKWSTYEPEEKGVCIAYASIYGNTKEAISYLTKQIKGSYVCYDLARCDLAEAISMAFKYSSLIIASPTYNASVFPAVQEFMNGLLERNYQNRQIGIIENGSWAPVAKNCIMNYFKDVKGITFATNNVTIPSKMTSDNEKSLVLLAEELA